MCPGALLGERRQDLQRIGRSDEAVAGAGFEDVGGLPVRGVMGARRFAARAGEVAGDAFAADVVEAHFQRDEGVFHPEGNVLRRVKEKKHPCSRRQPGAVHQAAHAADVIGGDFGTDDGFAIVQPDVVGMGGKTEREGGEGERFHRQSGWGVIAAPAR